MTPTPTLHATEVCEQDIKLPWRWAICPTCQGRGRHSLRLGAVTQTDREQNWSREEWAEYMAGDYDQSCGCEHGKVRVVDEARCPSVQLAAYRAQLDDEEEFRSMQRAEMGWEANSTW